MLFQHTSDCSVQKSSVGSDFTVDDSALTFKIKGLVGS